MKEFTYQALPSQVVFGVGSSRNELTGAIERAGFERLLVVAADAEQELARGLIEPLGSRVAAHFTEVRPHVPIEVAQRAQAAAVDAGADSILSIGGGSTVGTAKAIAKELGLPIAAVPTTYAGSEMTPVWGLTENKRKVTGVDLAVLPRLVIYDPELTLTLPPSIAGPSAMNAVAHCAEAFYAPANNPIASLMAEEGIRAIAAALPDLIEAPDALEFRSEILYGAYLAGAAFASAGGGLHHKICHTLGGMLDLPHAETHAIVLPHVIAFNAPSMPAVAGRIAGALGTADPGRGLFDLTARIGAPTALADLGMRAGDIPRAVADTLKLVPPSNPRPVDSADLTAILTGALGGDRPG